MSWPSTDRECEIQDELDEFTALKIKLSAWTSRSPETRRIVLGDLRGMAHNWKNAADDDDGREDAETLAVIIKILEGL